MPVCTSCGQDNPDIARFCLACGSPLAAAPPAPPPVAPEDERKLITVVFTDLVGSTSRSEHLDVEDVKAMVAPYHARVRAELERFGGTFEKFSGDAVMALFGAPVAHEDDPERAVRAALAIGEALAEMNAENEWLDLHVRTGVNTGEALVMLEARPEEGEWMAAGDVMNTAARIQSGAPVDGILVGAETYRATRHVIEYEEAEPIQGKGKSEPIPVWRAVGLKAEAASRRAARGRLVGRERELERLFELWESALADRRPAAATLVGAPGIGKTRVLEEFTARVEDTSVHWGRCLSYGEGITYWPVIEILKDLAGITHDDDAGAISIKLGRLLFELGTDDFDELRTMATALANLIGPPTTPEQTYSAKEITQAELHWGIRRVLELTAARQPLLLVFEDLHWAEPTLLEFLDHLLTRSEQPVFVLASARPEFAETSPALLGETVSRRVVRLEALTADDSEALLGALLGTTRRPDGALGALLENAAGNPLFLEETVRMLVEEGMLDPTRPETLEELGDVPVPSSLQALIGSRLDRLPGGEKRRAQHASVVGSVFWPGAVAHAERTNGAAPAEAAGELLECFESLERREVVYTRDSSSVAGEREYAFRHALIRDVAYGRLPKGRRAELHVRVADWQTALPAGEEEFVEIVAYHLEQACRLAGEVARSPVPPPVERAVEALVRAAEKAERREGTREADRFYERALEIVGEERRETAVELRLRRCRIMFAQGDYRPAYEQLLEIAEDAQAAGRLDVRCAALVLLANIDHIQGRPAEARRHLADAQPLAVEIGDSVNQVRAAYTAAYVRGWSEGDAEGAVRELRDALAIAEALNDRALRIEAHLRIGTLLFNVGELAAAEEEFVRLVTLAGELGSHRDEARATSLLAFIRFCRGDLEQAEALALQAREWLDRTCDSILQIQNLRYLAKYALARDDAELAEERLRDALPLALESGGWLVTEVYRYLVEALVRQERIDDAAELLAFAARSVPEEDAYARAALLLAEATVAAARAEQAAASTSFAEALRLLEEQQLVTDLAEARVMLARALRAFGDSTGARTELERARAAFMRMEARGLVDEVDGELTALAEGAGVTGPLAAS